MICPSLTNVGPSRSKASMAPVEAATQMSPTHPRASHIATAPPMRVASTTYTTTRRCSSLNPNLSIRGTTTSRSRAGGPPAYGPRKPLRSPASPKLLASGGGTGSGKSAKVFSPILAHPAISRPGRPRPRRSRDNPLGESRALFCDEGGATQNYERGVDLVAIQQMLGRWYVGTLMRYVTPSATHIEDADRGPVSTTTLADLEGGP